MMKTAAALVLLLPSLLLAAAPPPLEKPVTDTLGLLSPEQTETVAGALVRLRKETGAQMAVLIVGSTGGEPIEDYSLRAARAWSGGQRGEDNGLLYVLAVEDRRMRLEVGRGLEKDLPDDAVERLLDAQRPLVRAGDYSTALVHIVQGVRERLPQSERPAPRDPTPIEPEEWYIEREDALARIISTAILMSLMICLVLRPGVRERLGNRLAGILCGLLLAAALFFLHPLTRSFVFSIDSGTLVGTFCVCNAMMLGSGYLIRNGHGRWGTATMVGTLSSHVYAWMQDAVGAPVFPNTLIIFFVATLIMAAFERGGPWLFTPAIFLFGGAAAHDTWRRGERRTSGSHETHWDSTAAHDASSSSGSSLDSSSSSSSSNSGNWNGGGGDFGGGGSNSSW